MKHVLTFLALAGSVYAGGLCGTSRSTQTVKADIECIPYEKLARIGLPVPLPAIDTTVVKLVKLSSSIPHAYTIRLEYEKNGELLTMERTVTPISEYNSFFASFPIGSGAVPLRLDITENILIRGLTEVIE